ncbi:MAG: hypothetical protein N2C14_32540 [Planctomycetales bacterium]
MKVTFSHDDGSPIETLHIPFGDLVSDPDRIAAERIAPALRRVREADSTETPLQATSVLEFVEAQAIG